MDLLIDVFGFISIVLRSFVLAAEALTVGGVVFRYAVQPALDAASATDQRAAARMTGLLCISALVLAAVVLLATTIDALVLITTVGVTWWEGMTAPFAVAGVVIVVAALSVAAAARMSLRTGAGGVITPLMVLATIVIVISSVATTHAVGRLDDRAPLLLASALHQTGAFVWIGGIPYFLIALAGINAPASRSRLALRFSRLCVAAVLAIVGSAMVYAVRYIGSFDAVYGTAYGAMVATKAVLFAGLLAFGAANYLAVRRLAARGATALLRLRRFAEVEVGVGIAAFFVAASLTSSPPAVDLTRDRVSWQQVVDRVLTPRPPRLVSPAHAELAIPQEQERLNRLAAAAREQAPQAYVPGSVLQTPSNAADIAWSEYNHNWSGIQVLIIGILALAWRAGWPPARHWPLLFIVLAIFVAVRSDPEAWPLGDIGFLASMRSPEVLQHRLMTLIVAAFGIFEWRVRTGGLKDTHAVYVFPLSNAIGGILLLTHTHALANLQESLLVELNHLPLGLLAIAAAGSRWLELRTDSPVRNFAAWIWPLCFIGVGLGLLVYRES